jgi:DNA (cytosine-5)-methyltransferase 1
MKCNQIGVLSGGVWDKMYEQFRRVYATDGLSPTLHTCGGGNQEIKVAVMENNEQFRIRKLTPLECWRLMGFDDEDFRKAEAVNSNSQLYKQAGNSIVVNVLEGILRNLLLSADPHKQEAQNILKWLDEVMEVRD